MLKPTETEQKDIVELIHRRRKKSSTIFCSQVHWDGWYEQLGGDDSPLAEAILDRIAQVVWIDEVWIIERLLFPLERTPPSALCKKAASFRESGFLIKLSADIK